MISLALSFAFSLFAAWVVISPFNSSQSDSKESNINKDKNESR